MKKAFITTALGVVTLSALANDTIFVNQFQHVGPVALRQPVMLDSIDLQGRKFDSKSLLDTYINLKAVEETSQTVQGPAVPGCLEGQDLALHLLSFTLHTSGYTSGELQIKKAPANYQLYENGRKSGAGALTLEPGSHRFVVKYLSEAEHTDSLEICYVSKDSTTALPTLNADKGLYSIDRMMTSRSCYGVQISPDGNWLYSDEGMRTSDGKGRRWFYLQNLKTGQRREIQYIDGWMPVSNKYYRLREGAQGRELVAFDPQTETPTVLCNAVPEGWITILPNERQLIVGGTQYGPKELNPDVYELVNPEDRQPGWRDRSTLSLFDMETGVVQPIFHSYHNIWLNDVTMDSRYALVSTSKDCFETDSLGRPVRPTSFTTCYRLDLETFAVDTLFTDGFASVLGFSPDGSEVLIQGSPEAFDRIGCVLPAEKTPSMFDYQAYILNVQNKQVRPVTRDFDPSVSSANWSLADGMIYLRCENRDSVSLYRLDPKSEKILRLDLPEENIKGFSLPNQGRNLVFYGQSAMNGDRVYLSDLSKTKPSTEKLSLIKQPQLLDDLHALNAADIEVATCLPWTFRNSIGDEVTCRYYLPVGFDPAVDEVPGEGFPMITYYYGGCSPTSRSFESSYPWQIWAAQGYAVLVVQPSGAAGFGQEWASRHVNTAGADPARDIIEGVKQFCAEHKFVNPKKVGCCGASYGGFMTQYLQTVTDIFACAISHAGISDHTTYWGYGYWGYTYSQVSMANSYPWSETDLYVKQSPIYNVDKIHTPILFLHGTEDTNVPINNSIQMFTALKLLGRETAMVCVKGENHGVSEFNKRIQWLKTSMAWFQKYLKDDSSWWDAMYPKKDL